jgi:peptide/nickel transport system permease protein
MTGVLVIEVVFGFSGLGDLTVSSVVWRDVPVLQFCAVLITMIYVVLYSIADLAMGRFSARQML